MKQWYYAKEPHEQRIILVLAAVIGLSLIYLLIWSPISESFDRQHRQVEAQRKLLNWMQGTASEIATLQGHSTSTADASAAPLLSTVDSTIRAAGLGRTMKRLEPQGNDKVQIWFESTNFDQLMSWLGQLSANNRILISSINIERQDQPGLVNARLVLVKG